MVAVYTLAALVLGVAGGVVFTLQLRTGLQDSLDAALDARAAPLVDALRQPSGALPNPAEGGADHAVGRGATLETITVVYRPDGTVASSSPRGLGPIVLSAGQLAAARVATLRLTRAVGGGEVRLLATGVPRPDGGWVVVVGTDERTAEEAIEQVDRGLLIAGSVLLAAVAAGTWLLSGAALRPVERLRAEAEDLGAHDAAGRLSEPTTNDEIAALARTFNALLGRLHRSLARQRDLVADAGHELRTPLAVLRTELELADRPHRSKAELVEAVTHARGEVDRLSQLADDLLFLARADGAALLVDRRVTDLTALLTDAVRAARVNARARLAVQAPPGLVAEVDAVAMRRAVDNLLSNAVAATPPGGSVVVSAHAAGADVEVSVADTGPGFPPDFLPEAFERFRRAEPSRSATSGGAGLGLAIVAEIAAAHEGTVTATNQPGGGALVRIRVPARA